MGEAIDENNSALETKINAMDADRDVIKGSLEATQVDVSLIQDELAIEGLGGFYRQGQDLETASISSNGSGFIDELYIPPDTDTVDVDEKPQPVGGTYQYHVKNENGSYTKLLSFDKDGLDMGNKPISNISSGQNEDTNAANIGDVKRLISNEPDGGLLPTNNQWDMLSYPLINAGSVGFNEHTSSSGSGASYARFTTGSLELGAQGQVYFEVDGVTVGDINRTRVNFSGSGSVLGKNSLPDDRSPYELINWETLQGYPDNGLVPTNDVWNMTNYPLSNVPSVGYKTDHTGARVGFEEYKVKLLGDTIEFTTQNDSGSYGSISSEGLQLNDLEVKNVRESTTPSSAATVGQVNSVKESADSALAKTSTNETNISNLGTTVGNNTSAISDNTKSIVDVNTLANANKEAIESITIPSIDNLVEKDSDASLNSVTFGNKTKIDWRDGDLGLVLQGDTIYAKSEDGYEHFYIEDGNFNVKSKKIQKLRDGVSEDDAATVRQVGAVESKSDAAQSTADAADSLSKANQTAIGNLSTTVGDNTSGISTNAKAIGDLSTKVDGVESTANAADTLSKSNKAELDGLPADVTPRVQSLEENALQKDDDGYNANTKAIYGVKSIGQGFDGTTARLLPHTNSMALRGSFGIYKQDGSEHWLDVNQDGVDAKDRPISNLASGQDNNTRAANIGDVKRLVGGGSGLKPVDSTWDMLGYPVINIGTSTITTSAATVGQVNAVEGKADTNASNLSNLSTTVGQQDAQIRTNTADIATVTTTANAADTLSKSNQAALADKISTDSEAQVNSLTNVSGNYNSTDNFDLRVNGTNVLSATQSALYPKKNIVFQSGSALIKGLNDAQDVKDAMNKQSVERLTDALDTRIDNIPTPPSLRGVCET